MEHVSAGEVGRDSDPFRRPPVREAHDGAIGEPHRPPTHGNGETLADQSGLLSPPNPEFGRPAIRASASRFSDVTRMLVCISRVCALLRAYRSGIHLRTRSLQIRHEGDDLGGARGALAMSLGQGWAPSWYLVRGRMTGR